MISPRVVSKWLQNIVNVSERDGDGPAQQEAILAAAEMGLLTRDKIVNGIVTEITWLRV